MTITLNPGDRETIVPSSGKLTIVSATTDEIVIDCVATQPPPPPPPQGENLLQFPEFAVLGMDQSDDPIPPWQTENGFWGISLKNSNPSPDAYALKGKLASEGAATEHSARFPNGGSDRCWQDITVETPHTIVMVSYQEVGRAGTLKKRVFGRNDSSLPWQLLWEKDKENPSGRDWSSVISHQFDGGFSEYRFEIFYAPLAPSGYKITNVSLSVA